MAAEIFAGLAAFKQILDTASALKDMNDQTVRAAAVIDLQKQILDAQRQQFEVLQRNAELEATVAAFEKWNTEAQRYQLKDYGGNTFAWEIRADAANGEPIHRLCPTCFSQRRKSILQFDSRTAFGQDRYECPPCKVPFEFGVRQDRLPRVRPSGSSWMSA
jgi:hypothetical protein